MEGPRHASGLHPARHAPNGRGVMAFLSRRPVRGSRSGVDRTSSRRRAGRPCRYRRAAPASRRRPRSSRRRSRVRRWRRVRMRTTSRSVATSSVCGPPPAVRREHLDPVAGAERSRREAAADDHGAEPVGHERRDRPDAEPASLDRVTISPAARSDSSTRPTIDAASRTAPGGTNSDGTEDAASNRRTAPFRVRGRSRPPRRPPAAPRPGAALRPGPGSRAPPRTQRAEQDRHGDQDLGRERPAAAEHAATLARPRHATP